MSTLARIAGGISDDIITRAADVMLKERRRLIVVLRRNSLQFDSSQKHGDNNTGRQYYLPGNPVILQPTSNH